MLGIAVGKTEVQTLLDNLTDRTQELYQLTCRAIRPRTGWVLLRILDREQTLDSGIVVPSLEQNKPLHEGIVIATWEPYTEEKVHVEEDGKRLTKVILHKSDLKVGDHVLIDHWCGVPVEGDSKLNTKFRLVKEFEDPNLGGVKAVVEYGEKMDRPKEILKDILLDVFATEPEERCNTAVLHIEDRFHLVDRDKQSVTLSGR